MDFGHIDTKDGQKKIVNILKGGDKTVEITVMKLEDNSVMIMRDRKGIFGRSADKEVLYLRGNELMAMLATTSQITEAFEIPISKGVTELILDKKWGFEVAIPPKNKMKKAVKEAEKKNGSK